MKEKQNTEKEGSKKRSKLHCHAPAEMELGECLLIKICPMVSLITESLLLEDISIGVTIREIEFHFGITCKGYSVLGG